MLAALLPAPDGDWSTVWDELERLHSLTPGTAPAQRLEEELRALSANREREARKVHDRAEAFRSRVLLAEIERWRGAQPRGLGAPGVEMDYQPREARFAAEVLAPGSARADAALRALRDANDPRATQRDDLALAVAREEYGALRLEGALALAAEIEERTHAGAATQLALRCESLLGRGPQAEERLARAARRASGPAPELDVLAAELALAAGEPGRARRCLGRGLAAGTPEARLALARRDLEEGQRARAARLAADLLGEREERAPQLARQGWSAFALALLPPGKANSASGVP